VQQRLAQRREGKGSFFSHGLDGRERGEAGEGGRRSLEDFDGLSAFADLVVVGFDELPQLLQHPCLGTPLFSSTKNGPKRCLFFLLRTKNGPKRCLLFVGKIKKGPFSTKWAKKKPIFSDK